MQLVYQEKWVPMQPLKLYTRINFFLAPLHALLKDWDVASDKMSHGTWFAYFQDGRDTYCQNANCHNSVTDQLIFILLVSKMVIR